MTSKTLTLQVKSTQSWTWSIGRKVVFKMLRKIEIVVRCLKKWNDKKSFNKCHRIQILPFFEVLITLNINGTKNNEISQKAST